MYIKVNLIAVPSKSSAAITKTTIVKKSASTVVNDPLKDLLDN